MPKIWGQLIGCCAPFRCSWRDRGNRNHGQIGPLKGWNITIGHLDVICVWCGKSHAGVLGLSAIELVLLICLVFLNHTSSHLFASKSKGSRFTSLTLLQYMSPFIGTRRLGPISIDGVEFWNCFILRFTGEEASQVTRRPDTDLKEGLHDVVPVS